MLTKEIILTNLSSSCGLTRLGEYSYRSSAPLPLVKLGFFFSSESYLPTGVFSISLYGISILSANFITFLQR